MSEKSRGGHREGEGGAAYLKLLGPGAVPVRQSYPLDKELSLRSALKRTGRRGIGVPIGLLRGWHGHGWLPPPPVQDLLHTAFEHGALGDRRTRGGNGQKEPIIRGRGGRGSHEGVKDQGKGWEGKEEPDDGIPEMGRVGAARKSGGKGRLTVQRGHSHSPLGMSGRGGFRQ